MAEIVLATLNAKFIHTAFGLRYLLANLGDLRARAELVEFDINQRPLEIAGALLAREPRVLGLGVHIWNAAETTALVAILKRLRPSLPIILGGPEVSHETLDQPVTLLADCVITGEADLAFPEVCRQFLQGRPPAEKVIRAPLPDLARVAFPYDEYDAKDLAHRIGYVEASRGCPFSCEFCLSSLEEQVRAFPLKPFLAQMQWLLDRGLRHFKFVDRTFNLDPAASQAILRFFLARLQPGLFLHFEIVPDRLPHELRQLLAQFPPGSLQLEVGVQTFDPATAERISRRQNYARLEENLRFLRRETSAHVHADLIAGLPGEDLASFGRGFDRLLALEPQEIQVGILKRLRGAPIARHTEAWGMKYNPNPPYDLLENGLIPFAEMLRLRRFARFWDLVGNSGNFAETAPLLWRGQSSAFLAFMEFSDWLHQRAGRTDSIALVRLAEFLFEYLTRNLAADRPALAAAMLRDFQRAGRREMPGFLTAHLPDLPQARSAARSAAGQRRQARHA